MNDSTLFLKSNLTTYFLDGRMAAPRQHFFSSRLWFPWKPCSLLSTS